MVLLTVQPALSTQILAELGQEKLNISHNPAYHAVNTVLLYLCTWFWVRYYQTVIYIENLYTYVHAIEDMMRARFSLQIAREGEAYKQYGTNFRLWIARFYTGVAPLLIIGLSVSKIIYEWFWDAATVPLLSRILDTLGVSILVITTLSYFVWTHTGKN
jgi:hypothetical protein